MKKYLQSYAYIKFNIYIVLFYIFFLRGFFPLLLLLLLGFLVVTESKQCVSEKRMVSIQIRKWFSIVSLYIPLFLIAFAPLNYYVRLFSDLLSFFVFLFIWLMMAYINNYIISLDHTVNIVSLDKKSSVYSFFKSISRPIVLIFIMILIIAYNGLLTGYCPCYKDGTVFMDRSRELITEKDYYYGLSGEIVYFTFLGYSFFIWDKFWHQEKNNNN